MTKSGRPRRYDLRPVPGCENRDVGLMIAALDELSARLGDLIGDPDYFEVYRLSAHFPVCCDETGRFEAALYFDEASTSLFDWGMTTAFLELPMGRKVRWSVAVEFPRTTDWAIRFGWEWRF